jgi:tetratricopeptide (TPR) repeat protein
MAQLYRDKENDQDRAVELFNQALDLNPTFLEAFERINKILTGRKDWKELERAFRKMLKRLAPTSGQNADLEFNLWHNLGLIYRDRLHDSKSAIEAFKMATRYKPDEAVERQILAELYESTDQTESAIGEHAIVLQKDPMRVDPYRSLYKLYMRIHEYDRAWCMCAALAFLHKADEEEQRFFEDYRPHGMIQVKSRLDNEQWVKNLFHKDENLYIGKIFEMITPAAIVAKTNQLRAARQLPVLDKRFKQDPATSTVTFAKTFGWAAQVLGVPMPELYVRNDVPGALAAIPASPPASVAGQTVLTGFTPQELTFIVGKHLSSYRGEHYIRNLFPTMNELKVLLFAAIKVIMNDFAIPPDMAQAVNQTAAELVKYMQPIQRDGLRLVVQKFMEDGAKADLKRWMQTVETTACRAGLLLCADLEIAKKIIAAEPQLPGDLPPTEKMKELIVFSVSEQYFSLRKALGIAVGSTA